MITVHSTPLLPTHVTTAVGNLTALPLGVCHFTTEAGVGSRVFHCNILAGWTTPSFSRLVRLRGRRPSPFLDAVQVEDVEAALAAPHRSHDPDYITAHHALVLLLRQLLDQTTCLRLFALGHLVPAPLSSSVVLMVRSSPSSALLWCVSSGASSSFKGRILRRPAVIGVVLAAGSPL